MTRLKLPATRSLALCFMLVLGGASLSGCQNIHDQLQFELRAVPPAAQPSKVAVAEPIKPAVAQPSPAEVAGMIAPMVEKRETLTASGYAVISVQNHRNPAQQRLLAIRASKLDAYRSLTEQVYGQQLDASTSVADMVVQSDTFRTRVEGVIYGAVLVSITPTSDDTYETTLSLDKAVVKDLRTLYLGQVIARNR
jgi:outer membrane protein FlgP